MARIEEDKNRCVPDPKAKKGTVEKKGKARGRNANLNVRNQIDDYINEEFDAIDGSQTDYMTHQPGILKNGELMPHQLEGLNWMIGLYQQNSNGILADQMGLGKTVEVSTFILIPKLRS